MLVSLLWLLPSSDKNSKEPEDQKSWRRDTLNEKRLVGQVAIPERQLPRCF